MIRLFLMLQPVLATLLACSHAPQTPETLAHGQEVIFPTADSVRIVADLHIVDEDAATIILLHQAGANGRGEYGPILPKLTENDFNLLVVDLRNGGQLFGSYNRTVAKLGLNRFGYCDALLDLVAAIEFVEARLPSSNIILWGSSYSAALCILASAQFPKRLSGALAFSPASGGPMEACNPNALLAELQVPLLLLRPEREMEVPSVQTQFDLAQAAGHQTYIAKEGVHGSSMLVEERAGQVESHFKMVLSFLRRFAQPEGDSPT